MVRLALDANERQMRVLLEGAEEGVVGDVVADAGEMGIKKGAELGGVGFEIGELLLRHEKGACERAILVRNGNEHEVSAGPDVQVVRGDAELGLECVVGGLVDGLHAELAPHGVDEFLLVVDTRKLHDMVSRRRVRAVGSNHKVKVNLNLLVPAVGKELVLDFEPRLACLEVYTGQLVVEEYFDVGKVEELVEQLGV